MARKRTFRQKKELTDEELRELYNPTSKSTGKKYKKAVGFRVRDNESTTLLRWIEYQTNFSESVRHLIEKHLLESGTITDLSKPRDLDELFEERFSTVSAPSVPLPVEVKEEKAAVVVQQAAEEETKQDTLDTVEEVVESPVEDTQEQTVVEATEATESPDNDKSKGEDYEDLADAWA